jgi:hypothetical protein
MTMSTEVPRTHPLRRLFRWATREAFRQLPDLADRRTETYIAEEVLGELVHVDRIYLVRDARGRRLTDLAEMVYETSGTGGSGLERELEVNQHVGDFALFTAGLFPEGLDRRPPATVPLLARVGGVLVPCSRQLDYYLTEGRYGYRRAAELWERLSPDRAGVFRRLAHRFDGYVGAMGLIRCYLHEDPYFRRLTR